MVYISLYSSSFLSRQYYSASLSCRIIPRRIRHVVASPWWPWCRRPSFPSFCRYRFWSHYFRQHCSYVRPSIPYDTIPVNLPSLWYIKETEPTHRCISSSASTWICEEQATHFWSPSLSLLDAAIRQFCWIRSFKEPPLNSSVSSLVRHVPEPTDPSSVPGISPKILQAYAYSHLLVGVQGSSKLLNAGLA